jgi:glutamate/tyrosine decarboxylase-like PLP-dependent enzyme
LKPWLIIASAGSTDVGAVDPLDEIGEVSVNNELWLHVDAAYGGFFVLCKDGRKVLQGMNRSDSIVMDPHKGLFLPYGSGAVLVRDGNALARSHYYDANYMQDANLETDMLSPADLSLELSRPFRGLRLWLPLALVGLKPFRAALSEKLALARYFYDEIGKVPGFEVGPEPDLSVVTFRYVPKTGDANEFNKRLVQEIQNDGRLVITSTTLNGQFVLRVAVVCFRTHLDTIDLALELLKSKAKKIATSD